MATYWDPFAEMDRLVGSVAGTLSGAARGAATMPMDLFREGDHYVLAVDLPGVDPGTIDVSAEGRTLTVRAERTPRSGDAEWLVRERPAGTFARQLTLGRGLDLDRISASYADGVLSLTIPVAEEARPRRIEVTHAGTPRSIEPGAEQAAGQGSVEPATAG
ncbi:Hsp20/alpha crystallin family protein [Xylanimonas oleitrophica]|uniref:Hsp20/alpha crystallin family protein n=1 Tax=Xylanimonas oleitrophica TaxID=2607479 RepID=A0A2W5WP83_9MICO|nr:Hsp20/alpha crystallin family protein [Xylanimonas oleitrophica]PZR53207.1 Hsp20/alpha crystallin family protein [Xylanimonas oleitrophica]